MEGLLNGSWGWRMEGLLIKSTSRNGITERNMTWTWAFEFHLRPLLDDVRRAAPRHAAPRRAALMLCFVTGCPSRRAQPGAAQEAHRTGRR